MAAGKWGEIKFIALYGIERAWEFNLRTRSLYLLLSFVWKRSKLFVAFPYFF